MELIEDLTKYNPADRTKEQLSDDWRFVMQLYANYKDGKLKKYTKDQVIDAAVKIAAEIKKRVDAGEMKHEFQPEKMTESSQELFEIVKERLDWVVAEVDIKKDLNPKDLTPAQLKKVKKALEEMWKWAQQGKKIEGFSKEDIYNLHLLIVEEMQRRKIEVDEPAILKASELAPIHASGQVLGDEVVLEEVLKHCKDIILLEPYVYLTGGVVNRHKTGGDLDILVTGNRSDSINFPLEFRIGRMFPPGLSERLHLLFSDDTPTKGPFTPHVPLYRLKLELMEPLQEIRMSAVPLEKHILDGLETLIWIIVTGEVPITPKVVKPKKCPEGQIWDPDKKKCVPEAAYSGPVDEVCPSCSSKNTTVNVHGAIRTWWCQDCGKSFVPPRYAKEIEEITKKLSKKTKKEANYRSGTKAKNCGNCDHVIKGKDGWDCQLVEGKVNASMVCDLWVSSSMSLKAKAYDDYLKAVEEGKVFVLSPEELETFSTGVQEQVKALCLSASDEDEYSTFLKALPKFPGRYLKFPHAHLIWLERKTAILSSLKFEKYLNTPIYLLGDSLCFGIIEMKDPIELKREEVADQFTKHYVTEAEVKKDWPDDEILYMYPVALLQLFDPPIPYKRQPGTQIWVKEVEFVQQMILQQKPRALEKEKAKKEADISKKQDEIKIGRFFWPLKPVIGHLPNKFYTIENLLELLKPEDFEVGLAVQTKYDGVRLEIEKDEDKVEIKTDDGINVTHRLPSVVKEVQELKAQQLKLDSETEMWNGNKHFGREETAGYLMGKGPVDDSFTMVNIFDVLFFNPGKGDLHKETLKEREQWLDKLGFWQSTTGVPDTKIKLNRVPSIIVNSAYKLEDAVKKLSKEPGSEGAVIKKLNSTYPLTTIPSKRGWLKFKEMVLVNCIISKRNSIKTPMVWNYDVCLTISEGMKIPEKDLRKVKGKTYAYAGKSLNTKTRAFAGQICQISLHTLFVDVNVGNVVTRVRVYEPVFAGLKPDLKTPHSIEQAMDIAEAEGLLSIKREVK